MAVERQLESQRSDRLFRDDLAEAFVAAGPSHLSASISEHAPVMSGYLALRTRHFDDWLLERTNSGIPQVVILAAGLDARAYRLPLPADTRVFEIDLPEVVAFKENVLAQLGTEPTCAVTMVGADLREDWPNTLVNSTSFDRTVATAWLVEGVLPYLSDADNDRLLDDVFRLSTPHSHLAAEHVNSAITRFAKEGPGRVVASHWKSAVDDPVGWLGRHGWLATVADQATVAREVDRSLPAVLDQAKTGNARLWWISCERGGEVGSRPTR
ncbi:SAM-dependent methyltransferase [Amycolatopsis panacis]|uniref:SAM-dependent methyltransferase n=1 Tax=Amycolatopsis panacis TaxID=2340917 RepID=UPI00131409D3|nr:SAM-dependent methyltransferase [Amycolatopsis panacis]